MKRYILISFLSLALLFSVSIPDTSATVVVQPKKERPKKEKRPRHPNTPIGAPLDGGLLTILGAAGVAYFLVRKRNQNI